MILILTENDVKLECRTKSGFDIKLDDMTVDQPTLARAEVIMFIRRGLHTILKNRTGQICKPLNRTDAAKFMTSLGG